MQEKQYCMYIATNQRNTVLYTGVSGQLPERMFQHKEHRVLGFSKQYNIEKLVYYEVFQNPYDAIAREKVVKGWTRKKKIDLVNSKNSDWRDLSSSL